MAATRWVRPAPHHARLRDPRNHKAFFPAEGIEAAAHDFAVERLVASGDLVEFDPAAEPAPEPAPSGDLVGSDPMPAPSGAEDKGA